MTQYGLSIKYVVEHSGEKVALWVFGPNHLSDMIIENVPEDISEIGTIVEYSLPQVDEVILTDIIEEEDSVIVRVKLKARSETELIQEQNNVPNATPKEHSKLGGPRRPERDFHDSVLNPRNPYGLQA